MRWLLVILINWSCAAQSTIPEPPNVSDPSAVQYALSQVQQFTFAQDKQLHMGGCFVISSTTSAIVYKRTGNKKRALLTGLAVGIGAGLAKEIYDIKYGNPSVDDLLADIIGSAAGVAIIRITF